jgi:radical SAM protein (TIGR01212 family)
MFEWGHGRRFNSYNEYFKKTFGQRVQKVTINAGFTCPNRDGSKATGGCSYCNNVSFNPSYCSPALPVGQQIELGKEFQKVRYRRASSYLAYFQAYSNTYTDLETMKQLYQQALVDDVVGLVIGTRPDCIDDHKLDFFQELAQKYYIIIEYGIESCLDSTLARVNRQHDFECTREAIMKTHQRGIHTGGHVIFGLPGETKDMMLDQVKILSSLPLSTIKFHQLQIITGTRFEHEYALSPADFPLFELDEYIDFIVSVIERFNPRTVIERLASSSPPSMVIAPAWNITKYETIIQKIEQELERRDTWQGKLWHNSTR